MLEKLNDMKVQIEMNDGNIFQGEFSGRRSMLTFIQVPANEVDKIALAVMLTTKIDGLSSIDVNNDGSLNIALVNDEIKSVVVK